MNAQRVSHFAATLSVTLILTVGGLFASACDDDEKCLPQTAKECEDGVLYAMDTCGNRVRVYKVCEWGCNAEGTDCEECLPESCEGRCCGDDGCGTECPDNCQLTGQTCDFDTCECEGECLPMSCETLGRECDSWPDGCGGMRDCGSCPAGETCDWRGRCVLETCRPDTCWELREDCGEHPDGCGGTVDCGPCDCIEGSFADSPVEWELPERPGAWTGRLTELGVHSAVDCVSGSFNLEFIDLDGDERPDLVLTDNCDQASVGDTEWLWYRNTGEGFEQSSRSFALPQDVVPWRDWLKRPSVTDGGQCSQGGMKAMLRDMDGNRRPDLLLTEACEPNDIGTVRWRVHRNLEDGSGFDPDGQDWALPDDLATWNDWLTTPGTTTPCPNGAATLHVELIDLDGNLRPDLVVTSHCEDPRVGTDYWLIYRNTGEGFAETAEEWALPRDAAPWEGWLDRLTKTETALCPVGTFRARLFDLDGDRAPDLVITDDCDLGGVGTDRWRFHRNTGSGFAAEGRDWPLPRGVAAWDDWLVEPSVENNTDCPQGRFRAVLFDMDGDWAPDLLITDNCDDGQTGTTSWIWYRNTGQGFGRTERRWSLPAEGFGDQRWLTARSAQRTDVCDSDVFRIQTRDLTGDIRPDLVILDDCGLRGVGESHWRVYPTICPSQGNR